MFWQSLHKPGCPKSLSDTSVKVSKWMALQQQDHTVRVNAWPGCDTFLSLSMMHGMKRVYEEMFPFLKHNFVPEQTALFLLQPQNIRPERILCWQPSTENWPWSDVRLAMSALENQLLAPWWRRYATLNSIWKINKKIQSLCYWPRDKCLISISLFQQEVIHGAFLY